MTTYYCSPSGNNSGAGTLGDPWKDPDIAFSDSRLSPGDGIELRGGTYSDPNPGLDVPVVRVFSSFSDFTGCFIRAYADEVPIIDAAWNGTSINGTHVIHLNSVDQFVIQKINVRGAGESGIFNQYGDSCVFEDIFADECGRKGGSGFKAGIRIIGKTGVAQAADNEVRRVLVLNSYSGFAFEYTSSLTIEDVGAGNNNGYGFSDNGYGIAAAANDVGSSGMRINRAYVWGNSNDGMDISSNATQPMTDLIAKDVYSWNNGGAGSNGRGIVAREGSSDIAIIRSGAWGNADSGISTGTADCHTIRFINSFAYKNGVYGFGVNSTEGTGNMILVNCIAQGNTNKDVLETEPSGTGNVIDYNCWADSTSVPNQDSNSIFVDPEFASPDSSILTPSTLFDPRDVLATLNNIKSQIEARFSVSSGSSVLNAGKAPYMTDVVEGPTGGLTIPLSNEIGPSPPNLFQVGDEIYIDDADPAEVDIRTVDSASVDVEGISISFDENKNVWLSSPHTSGNTNPHMGAFGISDTKNNYSGRVLNYVMIGN